MTGVSVCESSTLVRDFVHSLKQQQFDSTVLRATIGRSIVGDELRRPESASDQAIRRDPMIFKVSGHHRSVLLRQTKVQLRPAGGIAAVCVHINLHIGVTL